MIVYMGLRLAQRLQNVSKLVIRKKDKQEDMIEVDPKLFIKCRLCLEDSGTYQIDPSIREQICYCFDINVEPYDGLPQLICKKCQFILSDYAKTKRSFIGKQDELKKRIQESDNDRPENDFEPLVKNETVDSVGKLGNSDRDGNYEIKRRRISESSNSSIRTVNIIDSKNQLVTEHSASFSTEITEKPDWKNEYRKTFVCRMCNLHWLSLNSAEKHKAKHKYLKSKHADVLSGYCVVELPKIDDKPNLTGSMDQVVFSKNKIIAKGNADYYIAYIGKNCANTSDNESINQNEDFNLDENSDSSLKINALKGSHRRRKRRRICSRSSNETVVLENKSMGKSQNECISIDDTDSDEENKKKQKTKGTSRNSIQAKMGAVAKLITTTHNKYLKKHEKPERPSLEQLNRKIISIGRQIINKRNFNSTRVMKYMEHMNLNVIWLTRSPLNVTSNSNYFKIIPRLRYPNEKHINDFAGYHKKYDKPIELIRAIEATLVQNTSLLQKSKTSDEESGSPTGDTTVAGKSCVVEESRVIEESSVDGESTLVAAASGVKGRPGLQYSESIHAAINTLRGLNVSPGLNTALYADTRKLLNSTPVANPRQLPKKFISDAKKAKAKCVANMPTLEVNVNELSEVISSGFENSTKMPIITFTTSLAVSQDQIILNDEGSNNLVDTISRSIPVNSSNESPKPAPRLKVKSVTELNMSTETLSPMNQPSAPQNGAAFNVQSANVMSASPPTYNCDDYIILDTVELPNTKTCSPFKYFRNLLQVHNLFLLDTDVTLSADFNTLIKFKVLYKQENKDHPVVLCLSLFCSDNTFCMKIKDKNEDNINMTKISANWQWEILKIYRGEVVTKLLNNAQKISSEVFEYTNRFLCLLKSLKRL